MIAYGTIGIDITPDGIGASWDLTGPYAYFLHGEGDATINNMLVGEYSISYSDVSGYSSPQISTLTLIEGRTTSFMGNYWAYPYFVPIPPNTESMPATFTMGGPGLEDQTPHQVTLTGRYDMTSTEVTNAQYVTALQWAYDQGYVSATSLSVQDALDGSTAELLDLDSSDCQISFNGGIFSTGSPDSPVVKVSWYGSIAYCDWLSLGEGLPRAYDHSNWECNGGSPYDATGYRLPTEAEWEFACRAGTTTHFSTGDCLDAATEANYNGSHPDSGCSSGPFLGNISDAGSYPANPWGLFDIHGNVWEWCNDWCGNYQGDEHDPEGVGAGDSRVFRGGSWSGSAISCRSAFRVSFFPDETHAGTGFRPVRSIQ